MSEPTIGLLGELVATMGAWAAAIMTPDRNRTRLRTVAAWNMPQDWQAISNQLSGSSATARCFLTGRPVVTEDLAGRGIPGSRTEHPVHAVVVVPLKSDHRVMGTLEIIADRPGWTLSAERDEIIGQAANRLAAMLESNSPRSFRSGDVQYPARRSTA